MVNGERALRAAVWACRDAAPAPAPGWGRRRLAVAGRKEADRGDLEARGARPRRSLVDGMAGCAQSAVGGDGVDLGSWVVGAGVVVVVVGSRLGANNEEKESISDEMPVAAVIPVDGRFFADKKLRPA